MKYNSEVLIPVHVKSQVAETSRFFTFLLKTSLLLGFVFISWTLPAQGIQNLDSYMEQLKASGEAADQATAQYLLEMTSNVQPTVYVGSSIKANSTDVPVRAIVKANYVSKLTQSDPLFNGVGLITIRLRSAADLNFQLNLNTLPGFPALKYVLFLCEFDCNVEDLEGLHLPNPAIAVFYKISIAS